jgi:hypothetical protein
VLGSKPRRTTSARTWRRRGAIFTTACATVLVVAACGGGAKSSPTVGDASSAAGHASSAAASISAKYGTNAQVLDAERTLKRCEPADLLSLVSGSTRSKFEQCVVPADHNKAKRSATVKAFDTCLSMAVRVLHAANFVTPTGKAGRVQFFQDKNQNEPSLAGCVVTVVIAPTPATPAPHPSAASTASPKAHATSSSAAP